MLPPRPEFFRNKSRPGSVLRMGQHSDEGCVPAAANRQF